MLKNVIKGGTGAAANIGKPAAGKTGTTDDNRDASFIGYTPHIVTGVWVGNDDNTVNPKSVQGGTIPALIWRDVMKVATEKYKNVDFDYPTVELLDIKPPPEEDEEAEASKMENGKKLPKIQFDEQGNSVTPSDVVKNFKQRQQERKQKREEELKEEQKMQVPVPAPEPEPAKAPVPIPMAVPESLQ